MGPSATQVHGRCCFAVAFVGLKHPFKSLLSGLIGDASSPVILGTNTGFSLAPNPLFSVTKATQSQMSAFCLISDN